MQRALLSLICIALAGFVGLGAPRVAPAAFPAGVHG